MDLNFKTSYSLFVYLIILIIYRGKGQEKFEMTAEKNEISYKKAETTDENIDPKPPDNNNSSNEEITIKSLIVCPPKDDRKPFLFLPCFITSNCGFLGKNMMCCEGRCVKGIHSTKLDYSHHHEPIFFGFIERKCPAEPLTELSEVEKCFSDDDCTTPRICCGEILRSEKKIRYCRTPVPVWDTLPLPLPVVEPLKTATSYVQCTPPPPEHLDLHPKLCQHPIDCFPNLCCQEKGKKFCRPPKRSLLTLAAEFGQKIIPEATARKFIERIS